RHIHQAKNPEKLNPKIRATPIRRPIEARSPIILNENARSERPDSAATIFWATILPSRIACWAVGGCDFRPFLMSGTNAQSPMAHTLGQSGSCKNWFTTNRPFSFELGIDDMSGLGTMPAVQTKVRDEIEVPSLRLTSFWVTLLTRLLKRISTPRRTSTFLVYSPRS